MQTNSNQRPAAIVTITSFRGLSVTAEHYYGHLDIIDGDGEHIELTRPIRQSEIEKHPERWRFYNEGDQTNAFGSWKDVLQAARAVVEQHRMDPGRVKVEGIPNTPSIPLADALKPLDTRPRCKGCGKVFKPGEGLYNTPAGLFCVNCYKR